MTSPHTTMAGTIRDRDDPGVFSVVAWRRTATVARMHTAFHRATRHEWMFRDAAHRQESRPV